MGWKIHQMDVKTTFLISMIEEEVYIEHPEGFETFNRDLHVCRLKRALYGLKQAPCAWYTGIDSYSTRLGFTKIEVDVKLCHIMAEGKLLIIILYVDNLILTGDEKLIKSCKEDLAIDFEMKDLGIMQYFLVNQLSQAIVNPTKWYWKVAKHVLSYLRDTTQVCLWYIWTEGVNFQGFTDADWVGSPSDRKSTSGGIFSIGLAAISWYSRKHRSVALSSAEAEYMVVSQVACEAIWMRKILVGFFGRQMDPTMIYYDNQSCIKLSENPVFHDQS
eukprot:PITA_32997